MKILGSDSDKILAELKTLFYLQGIHVEIFIQNVSILKNNLLQLRIERNFNNSEKLVVDVEVRHGYGIKLKGLVGNCEKTDIDNILDVIQTWVDCQEMPM